MCSAREIRDFKVIEVNFLKAKMLISQTFYKKKKKEERGHKLGQFSII